MTEATKLKEDLLLEFAEEKKMVNQHLSMLDPLALNLRKPIVSRIWSNFQLYLFEALILLSIVGILAFCFLRDTLYPFYVLARLRAKTLELDISKHDMEGLYLSIYAIAAIMIFLLFILGRCLSKIRKKNTVLQQAAKDMKTIVGDLLKRKAAIEILEQKYLLQTDQVQDLNQLNNATSAPNPAY